MRDKKYFIDIKQHTYGLEYNFFEILFYFGPIKGSRFIRTLFFREFNKQYRIQNYLV